MIKLINKYSPNSIVYRNISYYNGSILGIDTNLLIHKIVYAIRIHGSDIMNSNLIVTHIHTFLQKIIAFYNHNIIPIFVFDGVMPPLKYNTIEKRKLLFDGKYEQITDIEIDDIKTIIQIFGYPIICAPFEADSQLAFLSRNNLIDGVISDDLDMLVFGSNLLLKNFTVSKHKSKSIQEINLNKLLFDLDITHKQFVHASMLMGCDYCDKIFGWGPIKSYHFIKKYKSIKSLVKHNIIPDNPLYIPTYKYFVNPVVHKIKSIHYNKIKLSTIKQNLKVFLKTMLFTDNQISHIFSRFST